MLAEAGLGLRSTRAGPVRLTQRLAQHRPGKHRDEHLSQPSIHTTRLQGPAAPPAGGIFFHPRQPAKSFLCRRALPRPLPEPRRSASRSHQRGQRGTGQAASLTLSHALSGLDNTRDLPDDLS